MRLAHPDFKFQIEFKENSIPVMVIESPRYFREYVQELHRQSQGEKGRFVLSKDWKPIPFEKNMRVVMDVLNLDYKERRLISALYKQLENEAVSSKLYLRTMQMQKEVLGWMEEIDMESPCAIQYGENIDIGGILKILDVGFESQYESFVEYIIHWMEIYREYIKVSCFVLVNARDIFAADELEEFYKAVMYKKLSVLLIENHWNAKKCGGEKIFIIDKDLCEIYDSSEEDSSL